MELLLGGVDRADLASGTVINGRQMYVESWIPAQVKHPYPIVLVHGGGGQGLDWMGTPDGRPGWPRSSHKKATGFMWSTVRTAARPSIRSPTRVPATAGPLENISGRFTPPNPTANSKPLPFQHSTINGLAKAPWVRKISISSSPRKAAPLLQIPGPPTAPERRIQRRRR